MARIKESVEIRRPVDKVFAYTTDAKSWPQWQSTIPKAAQTSPGSVGVGTTFDGTIRLMGPRMKWTAIATEYEPNRKFGKNITSGFVTNEQHNTYEPVSGGTKLTIVYDLEVAGPMALFSPMLVSRTQQALKKALANLKGLLEAQT